MNTTELKQYIELNLIDLIRLYTTEKTDDKTSWIIVPYGAKGAKLPKSGHKLTNSSRDKSEKIYTSLDRAYAAIKKLGYNGRIEING
jgi:hypothetical protein